MDAALKKTGLALIVAGVLVFSIAPIAGATVESSAVRSAASTASGLGTLLFVGGCIQIAKAKGQPWYYGLLSCLGLAVLWFAIPEKSAQR